MSHDPETARAPSLAHGQVCYLQLPAADRARAAVPQLSRHRQVQPSVMTAANQDKGFSLRRNTRR